MAKMASEEGAASRWHIPFTATRSPAGGDVGTERTMIKTPRQQESDRPFRVGLAGLGKISHRHLEAIAVSPSNLELIGLCDSDPDRAPASGPLLQTPCFGSLQSLLAESNLDIISICTPSGLHAQQTIEAARAGVHVITEKPMATNLTDARRMIEECDSAGVRLFVVNQCRFNPIFQRLHRAIREGRFGRIFMSQINVFWSRPQNYYDADPWRGTIDLDGGALMNQAIHYVDLLHWLLGPIARIQAMAGTLARKIETEDSAVLNLKLANNALGSISVTMLAHGQNHETSITILGEKGTVRIGGTSLQEIQAWDFTDHRAYEDECKTLDSEAFSTPVGGHRAVYANVTDVLRGQCEAATDGREAYRSLEIVTAALRSARTGNEVELPLLQEKSYTCEGIRPR